MVRVVPEPLYPEGDEFTESATLWYADTDGTGLDITLEAVPPKPYVFVCWVLRDPDGKLIAPDEEDGYSTTEPVVTLELRPHTDWPSPSEWTARAVFLRWFEVRRETGDVLTPGAFHGQEFVTPSGDLAEWVSVTEPVEPGHVLEIDPMGIVRYRLAQGPCTLSVAGVVSTQPGMILGHTADTEGQALLALLGVVPVKVTDEGGPIATGDLLVVSSTPGYAMRWDPDSGMCGLVGKALEPHEEDEGVIEALLAR